MVEILNVRIINWAGIIDTGIINFGKFNLVIGENGSGKTALLDAIKYCMFGDVNFNTSTDLGSRSRDLKSYIRGYISSDGEQENYLRSIPVCSHILIECLDTELNKTFITGAIIFLNSSSCTTERYILKNLELKDIEFTYVDNGKIYSYTKSEFISKYGIKTMNVENGLVEFSYVYKLQFNPVLLNDYKYKYKSILNYKPEKEINKFVKEKVLQKKENLALDSLKKSISNINEIKENINIYENEMTDLNDIIKLFQTHIKDINKVKSYKIKTIYSSCLSVEKKLKEIEDKLKNYELNKKENEILKKDLEKNKIFLRNEIEEIVKQLSQLSKNEILESLIKQLKDLDKEKFSLQKENDRISDLQNKIINNLYLFNEKNIEFVKKDNLFLLNNLSLNSIEKYKTLGDLRNILNTLLNKYNKINYDLEFKLKEINDKKNDYEKSLIYYRDKKFVVNNNIENVKNLINKEFKDRNINSEAKLACEYVIEIKDEKWRKALEFYLGQRKYVILVDSNYYDIADEVFNKCKIKNVHLFNTKLLDSKELHVLDDSVYHLLNIQNRIAIKYFKYLLGNIHAVENIQDVKKYENALSADGKVSRVMDTYFLDFSQKMQYSLGYKSFELNYKKMGKELSILRNEVENLEKSLINNKGRIDNLNDFIDIINKDYNFDVLETLDNLEKDIIRIESEKNKIESEMSNNSIYLLLQNNKNNLENKLADIDEKIIDSTAMNTKLEENIKTNIKEKENLEKQYIDFNRELELEKGKDELLYYNAIADIDKKVFSYNETTLKNLNSNISNSRTHLSNRLLFYGTKRPEFKNFNIYEGQSIDDILKIFELYEERYNKIKMDSLEEAKAKLDEQTEEIKNNFKNQFVMEIYKSCEEAKSHFSRLNNKLKNLTFKSKYSFVARYITDDEYYSKVIKYAKFLMRNENLAFADENYNIEEYESIEKDIENILDYIINNNENKLEEYVDYRNYMNYEILADGQKLSKTIKFNSGAETQIPYLLVLICALIIIYDSKGHDSLRVVFMDEPFGKMSANNISIMLEFCKSENLQMLFFAPDKMDSIGEECDSIIAVQKKDNILYYKSFNKLIKK